MGATGLEPVASCVTGSRSYQLNYAFCQGQCPSYRKAIRTSRNPLKKLKERGLVSPYLRSFVVARINPLRWIKGPLTTSRRCSENNARARSEV